MFDKGKVERNEEKFLNIHNQLNVHLKASAVSYNNGDTFYKEFSDFISRLSTTFDSLQNNYAQTVTTYTRTYDEVSVKAKKDGDFSKDAEETIKGKTEDFIKKTKYLDELKAKAKENLGALNYKNVIKLKVKENERLNALFSLLFTIFYKEPREKFSWTAFKEAITKDKMEDFQGRLLNADFAKFPQDQVGALTAMKEDPWLKDFVNSKKEGGAILEIINYLEYVPQIVETQQAMNHLTEEISRIKYDIPRRTENAKSEASQAELLKQNLSHLDAVNARILKGAEPFGEEVKKTDEMMKSYDQHKKQLRTLIHDEFTKVKQVPREVYQGNDQ